MSDELSSFFELSENQPFFTKVWQNNNLCKGLPGAESVFKCGEADGTLCLICRGDRADKSKIYWPMTSLFFPDKADFFIRLSPAFELSLGFDSFFRKLLQRQS